jgi:hypothetical protein
MDIGVLVSIRSHPVEQYIHLEGYPQVLLCKGSPDDAFK